MRLLILLLFFVSTVSAQPLAVTNTFSNATVADATDINQNFADIVSGVNARLMADLTNYNTAVGHRALQNVDGSYNAAMGFEALRYNTSGNRNTASGMGALSLNREGSFNTASGNGALYNTGGSYNTAVGAEAMYTNSAGSRNTAIGYQADALSGTLNNATAIGYAAKVDADNKIQLGNADITSVNTSGKLTTGEVTYPNTDGQAGQLLATDGAGNLQWSGMTMTHAWVDANGEVVGYPNNTPGTGWSSANTITVRLPETDMVFLPSYTFGSGTGAVQYLVGVGLSYPTTGCNGDPVMKGQNQNGQSAAPFGVTMDGYYAYAGEPGIGEFARASYTTVNQTTGEITCVNGSSNIMYSEAIISSKQYAVPLAEPVILRWR